MTQDASARDVLVERARLLARPLELPPPAATQIGLLEFRLAQERYALETRHVREVYPFKDLTPLPCTPPFITGIVNVRGRIVPVFDLRKFFDLPEAGLTDLHQVILLGGPDLEIGLLADAIVSVGAIPADSLQPALPTLTGIRARYLKGVTADRLVVLDAVALLSDPKIVVNEEVDG